LTRQAQVRRISRREQARFSCMVHDSIPIEFLEYARPSGAASHRQRMETVAACADAVIVNSAATGRSSRPWIERSGRGIATHVALSGTEDLPAPAAPATSAERPAFVCLGTIEPRKNHSSSSHSWRHSAETMPAQAVPRSVIIGRRGWENEQVVDSSERCPASKGHVEEINGCSDQRMATSSAGARASVMPSFAEGFGMPVAEASSSGVSVICSDLAALREVGGNTPDYLDPSDGPGWKAMILDHARSGPAHTAQKARLGQWHKPSWSEHMDIVEKAITGSRRPTA
ncbi:hypothetical protein OY671_008149, partial [Metschnikowia pulcherrima]